MSDVTTCSRCRAGIYVTDWAHWAVDVGAERLRDQGWVGFHDALGERTAIHLGCLTWAEKDALVGGAPAPPPRAHPVRQHGERFVRVAAQPVSAA